MVYGVVRWKRLLDWFIRQLAHGKPDEKIVPFLWVGLYQLFLMKNVAEHAAVNETVEAVKQEAGRGAAGFANGIFRGALRRREELQQSLSRQTLGVRESHPDILLDRWTAARGVETAEALCKWDNQPAPIVIHPDTAKVTLAGFIKLLAEAGIDGKPHPADPARCIEIPHGVSLQALPGYADGLFSVHDPSTFAAVDLLAPAPGQVVLDACAAPGGKTILIAELMKAQGTLVAMDTHEDRLATVQANIARMKLPWVRPVQGDATQPGTPAGIGRFDRILADVPCTNTGVLRRRPDARWRFSLARMQGMAKTQHAILDGLAPLLAPGGRLVYSTCSLEPEEGEQLIAGWLEKNTSFHLAEHKRLIPPACMTDGIYAAALQRAT